jgi:hypothetical protein
MRAQTPELGVRLPARTGARKWQSTYPLVGHTGHPRTLHTAPPLIVTHRQAYTLSNARSPLRQAQSLPQNDKQCKTRMMMVHQHTQKKQAALRPRPPATRRRPRRPAPCRSQLASLHDSSLRATARLAPPPSYTRPVPTGVRVHTRARRAHAPHAPHAPIRVACHAAPLAAVLDPLQASELTTPPPMSPIISMSSRLRVRGLPNELGSSCTDPPGLDE